MPPKEVTYTDEAADLVCTSQGTTRFQWHPANPSVTVLFFNNAGDCENVRYVPIEHARSLWRKLLREGWIVKV